MPRRKKESERNEKPHKPRAFVFGDSDPVAVEHGKNGEYMIKMDD